MNLPFLKILIKANDKKIVRKYIEFVGLNGFEKTVSLKLSDGMHQRASISRGLASNFEILLLDEPFEDLDKFTRINMQEETLKICKKNHNGYGYSRYW